MKANISKKQESESRRSENRQTNGVNGVGPGTGLMREAKVVRGEIRKCKLHPNKKEAISGESKLDRIHIHVLVQAEKVQVLKILTPITLNKLIYLQ